MKTSLKNKIVFITGASSGVGRACAEHFAKEGAKVIVTARRLERLEALAKKLKQDYKAEVLPVQLDIQNNADVNSVIKNLPPEWKNIDILVNNAGLALSSLKMQEGDIEQWDTMIKTNVCGLLYVTRAILPIFTERNQGHIFNIGSVAGHETYVAGNVYCATKHAVRAISKSLRLDLLGSPIRVSEIAPGMVNTEFSTVRWDDKKRADEFYKGISPLVADDIADAVIYCATRPAHVDVAEMVIYPTAQASCSLVFKESCD